MKTIFNFLKDSGYEIEFISNKTIHAKKIMEKYIKIQRLRPSGYIVEIIEFASDDMAMKRKIECIDYKNVIYAIK